MKIQKSATKAPKDPKNVEYMEIKDYKMEMDDPTQTAEHQLVKKQAFTEEERREAFKKKLRKYSGKTPESPLDELT